MDMEVNNPNPATNASRTVHIILGALQAIGNKARKTTMFLNCTSSLPLRLEPDVGSSNCRSTPRVHIESKVPHLARSGAMFATIGQLGFHARTPNVRTAPSSRNASPTGRPVTLLCTALMPPPLLPPRHTGPCSVCIAETGICASVVLRSHNLLHAQAVQICPTSSHPQADDDCSPASASKFGGADTLQFLNPYSHCDAQLPSATTTS